MTMVVFLFGEDATDVEALSVLVKALNDARTAPVQLVTRPLRDPPILRRDAQPRKRQNLATKIAAFVRGASVNGRRAIAVVHRDCDSVEPAHEDSTRELLEDLRRAGVRDAVIASPAWEIEAWWMLFPEALSRTRPCWRRVDYTNVHVGLIEDAKKRLTRDLRPPEPVRKRCADYLERDGISVARHLHEAGFANVGLRGRSDSFLCFQNDLNTLLDTCV